jgi:hypothetical protein
MARSSDSRATRRWYRRRRNVAEEERRAVREKLQQFKLAFERTREADPRLVPYLLIAGGLGFLVPFLVFWLALGMLVFGIAFGFTTALFAAMMVFNRRVSAAQFEMLEGQPGAAAVVLQSLRGAWRVTPGVAFNRKQDMVHRVVGRPGVVLVGEGSRAGVRTLLKTEVRKMRRAVGGDVPVHELIVGTGEKDVDIRKLRVRLMKLKPALKRKHIDALETRLSALSDSAMPMPKGPLPTGKIGRGATRRMRRSGGRG